MNTKLADKYHKRTPNRNDKLLINSHMRLNDDGKTNRKRILKEGK